MKYQYLIVIYLVAINLYAYILYAIDKYKSKKSKWRIPEKTLITIALLGGSIGALLAMKKFRHKTKHKKFTIGVPLILIAQIVMFYMLIRS
ncbi:MAG: DUF1294 domain-containing protein [Bacteroidales bacterium]|nr:DUF1294 domain-containing protein [Bacteroidales bacterium]